LRIGGYKSSDTHRRVARIRSVTAAFGFRSSDFFRISTFGFRTSRVLAKKVKTDPRARRHLTSTVQQLSPLDIERNPFHGVTYQVSIKPIKNIYEKEHRSTDGNRGAVFARIRYPLNGR